MIRFFRAILAIAFLAACEPVHADTAIFSPSTTPVLSTDWTDIGVGPAVLQNLSAQPAYLMAAATKPAAGAIGAVLQADRGAVTYSVSTHLWARSVQAGTSVTLAVTTYMGAPASGAQKVSTTATIAAGQTTSGAIDLGTARLWAIRTPATLTATSLTFTASDDCSTYAALYDSSGTAVSWTVTAARYVVNANPAQWLSVRCLKIVIGASEGAARSFVIEAVP